MLAAVRFPLRVVRAGMRRARFLSERAALALSGSYPSAGEYRLQSLVPSLPSEIWSGQTEILKKLAPFYLAHRFDLLGSGWVCVDLDDLVNEAGVGDKARVSFILSLIDKPSYRRIDWHADVKSGFRWSPGCFGPFVRFGDKAGVDVKTPWELARLQHLPQLAGAYTLATSGAEGFDPQDIYASEFRNVALDFIGSNPPGWGVNWVCAMDVGIRGANLAMAWSLFKSAGARFDEAFERELAASLLAHGRFILRHLEWHYGARSNHYFADIAGLAFVAATLTRGAETDRWLRFTRKELEQEILFQILPDGAGFEASTSYHRLTAEMALYAVSLLEGLGASRGLAEFPAIIHERLARAAEFSRAITKPSGSIVQIGDNDSGRLFKLSALFDETPDGLRERHLDHRGFRAAAAAFGHKDEAWPETQAEAAVVQALRKMVTQTVLLPRPLSPMSVSNVVAPKAMRVVIPIAGDVMAGVRRYAFPDFGFYIWRGPRLFVAVRCGKAGYDAHHAHAHNDQLSVEIELDGVSWVRDPGSFLYTPDPAARDAYRSVKAHFAPKGEGEPGRLFGMFRLDDQAHAAVLEFGDNSFVGRHHGFGYPVYRRMTFKSDGLVIEDCKDGEEIGPATDVETVVLHSPAELARLWDLTLPFSPGYGEVA